MTEDDDIRAATYGRIRSGLDTYADDLNGMAVNFCESAAERIYLDSLTASIRDVAGRLERIVPTEKAVF